MVDELETRGGGAQRYRPPELQKLAGRRKVTVGRRRWRMGFSPLLEGSRPDGRSRAVGEQPELCQRCDKDLERLGLGVGCPQLVDSGAGGQVDEADEIPEGQRVPGRCRGLPGCSGIESHKVWLASVSTTMVAEDRKR